MRQGCTHLTSWGQSLLPLKNKGWTDNKGDTNIMINPFMQLIKEASKK